jgi:Xaa-Pro aminopeptidase
VNDRIARLRETLEGPLLVSDPVNVRYLSGLASSNAALLVESDRVRLFTDFRYAESARDLDGIELVETKRDLFQSLAEELSGEIGFEATSVTFERHARLYAGGVEPVPRYGVVEALRVVKDDEELDAVRRAAEITDEAFERLAGDRFIGRTESSLAWRMEQLLHELGGETVSFSPVVASGPNAARPHHVPGGRKVVSGDTVIVDAGCTVEGYCSDCTRTFAAGSLSDELRRAYEVCLDAEVAGVEATQPGASGPGVDAAARDRIEASGFGEHFGHGLGHGVGLAVHEGPRLAKESSDTLQERNVVTVEPGIYIPGVGGIRIEDLVVVREGGPEVLSSVRKDLLTVN